MVKNHVRIPKKLDIKEESPPEKNLSAREMQEKMGLPPLDKEIEDRNLELNLAGLVPTVTMSELIAPAVITEEEREALVVDEKLAADIPEELWPVTIHDTSLSSEYIKSETVIEAPPKKKKKQSSSQE